MTKLKRLLTALKEGHDVVLSTITNQHGEVMDDQAISFREGKWYLEEINCYSSSLLGMGTCQCNSHDPTGWEITQLLARPRAGLFLFPCFANIF